jgi:hypothetical protein
MPVTSVSAPPGPLQYFSAQHDLPSARVAEGAPRAPSLLELPDAFKNIANLTPESTFRDGSVIKIDNFFKKAIFYIRELFYGGKVKNDHLESQNFYASATQLIANLEYLLRNSVTCNLQAIEMTKTLLKVEAHIATSGMHVHAAEHAAFKGKVENLQMLAQQSLARHETALPNDHQTARWIRSIREQRLFAATCESDLPYLWKEIPEEAVLLYNPRAWMISHLIKDRNFGLSFALFSKKIKAYVTRFFTGFSNTHAELHLGKGRTYDLDKPNGSLCVGKGVYHERGGSDGIVNKVCYYYDVVLPNKEKMLRIYNARAPEQEHVASFDQLWVKMKQELAARGQEFSATFWDIAKVVLAFPREKNYDCSTAWDPNRQYGCSALIAALFGKFYIDIGGSLARKKKVDNVAPGDYLKTELFNIFWKSSYI